MAGATGSCRCTTSKSPARSSRRSVETAYGVWARFDTAPLDGQPIVGPSGTSHSGIARSCGRAPRCRRAVRRTSGSNGASTRTSCPADSSAVAKASMCRVTPPGYVQEYGETRATRISDVILRGMPEGSRSANPL